jgi:3-oxoacyl-[acyl-carrier-protein] synthase II
MLGAAGAVETVFSVLSMVHGIVPPTINLDNPMEESAEMDLVPHHAREMPVNVVVNNSFGFGGMNATLVLKKPD